MHGNCLSIATALLLYQASYYLYLLYRAKVWICPYFPYFIFKWHFLRGYSFEARILLLLVLVTANYPQIKQLIQGLYQKRGKGNWTSWLGLLLGLSFIFLEQLGSLELILWAYPSLLGLILLTLPLPGLQQATKSLAIKSPSHHLHAPWSISLPTK